MERFRTRTVNQAFTRSLSDHNRVPVLEPGQVERFPFGYRVSDFEPYISTKPVPYIFTAKHRESKEVESRKLNVSAAQRKIICKLDEDSEIKNPGYKLVLKEAGGTIHASLKAGDGVEKDGVLSFKFKGIDAETKYILEMQDDKGKVVEVIFSESKIVDLK